VRIEIRRRDLTEAYNVAIARGYSDDVEVLDAIAQVNPEATFYRNDGGKIVEYSSAEIITAYKNNIEVR
jgi:hypothetical protein